MVLNLPLNSMFIVKQLNNFFYSIKNIFKCINEGSFKSSKINIYNYN